MPTRIDNQRGDFDESLLSQNSFTSRQFVQAEEKPMVIKQPQIKIPRLVITQEVLEEWYSIVDACSNEIGWISCVEKISEEEYFVYRNFLPKQDVHSTTCELIEQDLADLKFRLADEKNEKGERVGDDHKIRLWGHSHVNMGCSPSGQDNKQMEEFSSFFGLPYCFRVIANKNGELRIWFYDYAKEVTIENVEWEVYRPQNEEIRKRIVEEIREKVRRKEEVYKTKGRFTGQCLGIQQSWNLMQKNKLSWYEESEDFVEEESLDQRIILGKGNWE